MVAFVVVAVVALVGWSTWRIVRGGVTGRWNRPAWWLLLAFVCLVAGAVVWSAGAFAGGHDIADTCRRAGQVYDVAYREEHWQEPRQWFPLHNRCNAAYDAVPGYVNPSVVILAVCTVLALGGAVGSAIIRRKKP
ncbi:hypothetical protein [Streptomyces sp. NPDC002133]|uniref:hypothetical protein n=1 Tax=Streptomyces sp. NPDC002133 TaxID=3154409 RepID=UPI0033278830